MPNKTDIANIALAKFREGRITSIESTTDPVAVVMNDQYDHAIELLLEEHRWNFAGKRVTLTKLAEDPPFGWDHQYALPSDCIRLKDVNGEDIEASSQLFSIEGTNLLTNDDVVTITYVAKITDTNLFSPSFVEALSFKLASITCGRLTGNTELGIALERQYTVALSKAIHNDAKASGSRDTNLMQRMMGSSAILGGNPAGLSRSRSATVGSGSTSSGSVAAHKHELTDLLKTGATDGQVVVWNDTEGQWEAGSVSGDGTGDVLGAASSTDNAITRFNGTGGKTIQNSGASIDDSGNLTANNFTGTSSGANTGDQDLSTYQVKPTEGAFVDGDKTKLDGIAAGAQVNDPTTLVDADIGVNVQAHSAVLDATTASFTTADETKLDAITGTNTGDEPAATTTTAGIVEVANQAEIDDGGAAYSTHAVSPFYLAQSKYITHDGVETLTNKTFDANGTGNSISNIEIVDIIDNVGLSTGVLTGGVLSTGAGASEYSISDGTGIIVDETGAITEVSWTGKSNITPTNIATNLLTWVSIDNAGNVVEMTSPCTPSGRRAEICLGVIVHVNLTTVDAVNNQQSVAFNAGATAYDLADALGFINVGGNVFSANGANLNLNKSVGEIFAAGSNYPTSSTNPHIKTLAVLSALTFQYRYSDGSNGATGTAITPSVLDDGAGGTVAVTNNRWSVQRIYSFVSNNVKIQLGVEEFTTKDAAIAGISSEAYVTEQSIADNGLLRGWLVVQEGATDLSDSAQAQFIEAGKLGEVGGATGGGGGGGGGDVATDAIWDVAGDLAVGSGADTAARLPIGSESQILKVVGGAVAWATAAGGGDVSDGDTLTTGLTFPNTGLHILDTNASHDMIVAAGSDLTADRTLTLTTGDANRTLTLGGDSTINGGTHSGTNTGDQTITLTGDVTGTGTGSFATTIAVDAVDIPMLSATGTASATTYLRGDNTWATVSGSGDFLANGTVPMTGDIDCDGNNIDDSGVLFQREQAAADADVAAQGQWWTLTATPNRPMFTDDSGQDFELLTEVVGFACSDETTALTTGEKVKLDIPFDFLVTRVYATLATAGTTSATTVDVQDETVSILNAVLSITQATNNAETSTFASAATEYQLTKGDALSIDINAVDSGATDAGLKVFLEGVRT